MNLLYMAPDPVLHPKGSAQRIEATVRALAAHGAQVRLLTPLGPEGGLLEGVEHRPVRLEGDNYLARSLAFRKAAVEALEERPDLAIFRSPWEGVPAVLSGVPCLYEAHGFPSVELPSHFPGLLRREEVLDRLIAEENLVLRGARGLVTPSRTGRSYLLSRGVPPERVRVIPNAVDLERFPVTPPPSTLPFTLAYLGTLAPWQGLQTLLEALRRLKGRLEVRVRLAGTRKGPWVRDLRTQARFLGVRSFLEPVGPLPPSDLPAFLAGCHACVAPLPEDPRNALQGCCPIKILEYLAAGRAVLSTRIRPVEEILRHGETGWLVRPGSPRALAEGILHLASRPDLVSELGVRGRAEAEARWGRERFVEEVGGLLRSSS